MWSQEREPGKVRYFERYTDPLTMKSKTVSITLSGKDTAANRKKASTALSQTIDKKIAPENHSVLSLLDLYNAYTAYQALTVKASTQERNKRTLKKLCTLLGNDTIVDNLTVSYINQMLLSTQKGPATLNEYLARLRAMLRWGYDTELVTSDIGNRLKRFKDTQTKRDKIADKYLEPEEIGKLLDYMQKSCLNWYYLTKFLLLSGLRIGEAIALEKTDVSSEISVSKTYDVINRLITTPKTNTSNRDVYIQPELQNLIKQYKHWRKESDLLAACRSSHFFYDQSGNYINYYAYEKYLKETAENVLQRRITVHTLRHTHASLLLAEGVSIDTISRRLGHENSKVTKEIYLHVTQRLKERDNLALNVNIL